MKYHFALLVVVCAHALARDESSKALKATPRVTQATWNTVVLRTDVKSTLFAKCVAAATTRRIQYYAIEWAKQGINFVKYNVNRYERSLTPVTWNKAIRSKDVIDCAKASKDYAMFQYDGKTCRMADRSYGDFAREFCDGTGGLEKDVVYINVARPLRGCPANTDIIVGDDGPLCLGVIQQDVPLIHSEASESCTTHYYARLYSGGYGVDFTTLRNHMRNKNYQGEFFVHMDYYSYDRKYKWVDSDEFSNSFIAVQPQEPKYQRIAVISSSHDYLLVMKNNTDLITGYICLGMEFPNKK